MQSRVKVCTRRLSERMSTTRPVQHEAPGANRSSRNYCHLYSRPTKRTLYPQSLLRFLQGFLQSGAQLFHASTFSSWNVALNFIFQQAIQCSFSVDSVQGLVPPCNGVPANICPWPCSSDQSSSTKCSTVTAAAPPFPESGKNRTFFLSGDSPGRAFDSRVSPYLTVFLGFS